MTLPRLLPPRLQVIQTPAKPAEMAGADAADWLYGVDQIQAYLALPDAKMVYRIRGKGAPIGKIPGIGMAARRSELDAWRGRFVPGLAS